MRSATVTMARPWRWQNAVRSGTRAIVPSSFMISQRTAEGLRPAMRARSTDASVWPARLSTPPACARSGNMWPGRLRSAGFVAGSMAVRTVAARSAAEIPVVVRPRASIETVKAVPKLEVFSSTIGGRASSAHRSSVRARQTRPRPSRAMKLIACGETFSAARTRSPSFSRSSSSTTTTNLPARRSATARSMVEKGESVMASEYSRLFVRREHFPHDVRDLPDRRVRLHRIDERRHDVLPFGAGLAEGAEGRGDGLAVPRPPELGDGLLLLALDRVVDVEDLERVLFLVHEVVDADDDLLAGVERPLVGVRRVHDLLLREAGLDGLDHPS